MNHNAKTLVLALAAAAIIYVVVIMVRKPTPAATGTVADNGGNLNLKYFTPAEFGSWWPMMSADLLHKLDRFRELWGYPVEISPVDGSRGRHLGPNDLSMHNVDHWGLVRAVDTFPKVPDGSGGFRYMQTAEERQKAFATARAAGFTGIGIYTDTTPGNLLHVDNRDGTYVATWSRIDGAYKGLDQVLA